MASMETQLSDSGEIKEWIENFRLNSKLLEILTELGVELVEDLDTIFQGDESLLLTIRAYLSAPDVDAFIRTYHTYKELVEDNNSVKSTSGDGSSLNTSVCDKFSILGGRASAAENRTAQKEANIARRIEVLEKKLKSAATLDLLIMLDCTGSMGPYIHEAKSKIRLFVSSIDEIYPDIQLRIAFVGYRDYSDIMRHVVLPFTSDMDAFQTIVAQQAASGGGDGPEDIAGALEVASELKWESAVRVLFHIGDAPCHGQEYHYMHDYFPVGDPYGLQPVTFLQSLHKQKVNYLFGKLTSKTDKMLQRFRELLGFDYIRVQPMQAVTMMSVITASVSSIISDSLSQSSSVGTSGDVGALKTFTIDEDAQPAWELVDEERAVVYLLRTSTSVEALISEVSEGTLEEFPEAEIAFLRCAKNPFARGGNKLAYRACTVDGFSFAVHTRTGAKRAKVSKLDDVVLKESVRSSKSHQTKEKFEEYVTAQRAALFLAAQYRTVLPAGTPSIEFAPIRLLQFLSRPGRPYFIEETYIPGAWERFNNNTGYCAPIPTVLGTHHEAVQAFSHWTHHVSGGRLMITDCQGCYDATRNTFILTDPAVHCVSLLAYGGTNMGAKGFERFFKTHRCNDICRALELTG